MSAHIVSAWLGFGVRYILLNFLRNLNVEHFAYCKATFLVTPFVPTTPWFLAHEDLQSIGLITSFFRSSPLGILPSPLA